MPGTIGTLYFFTDSLAASFEPMIRMAFLATVASFSINGVADLHTTLLKDDLLRDFYSMWPERFSAADAYLKPVRGRPNLEVRTKAQVLLRGPGWAPE